MKKSILLFSAAILVLSSCVSNPDGEKAVTTDSINTTALAASDTQLAVDTAKSTLTWIGKKVTGQHTGTVEITSGKLLLHEGKLSGGNFELDLTTINNTDQEGEYKGKLESHLKSADFFDVKNHPKASFEITSIAPGSSDSVIKVSGNLTIRGISKNITFDATTNINESSAVADANFNIAREDWGVSYTGKSDDLISKEINLDIHLVAGN